MFFANKVFSILMADRLFVVIFLQTCLYHVVHPSSYVTFTTSGVPQQINQLDIRSLFPGLQSITGFTGYVPITEPASRLLDQVIPSQIVPTDSLSRSMSSILPNPGPSNYKASSEWPKTPGCFAGDFIRGIFQVADNSQRLTSPISRPACGVSESGGSNFHESTGSNDSGRGFSGWSSGYDESAGYCGLGSNGESASSKTQSKSNFGKPFSNYDRLTSSQNRLSSSIKKVASCKSRSDSNLGGSCCKYGGLISSYGGLGRSGESANSNTLTGCNFGRSYSNYDVSASSNSGLECNIDESVSSKTRSYSNIVSESAFNKDRSSSNFGDTCCSYNELENSRGELVPSKGRPGSNFGSCSKNHHGSTNSNESTNGSGRMGSYGSSDRGAVGVAGELPVVGRTTVVGQVPITGGVKFNGFIPAAGRVSIGGSCYCGPPFAF